jgi:hypothetical protein
MIWPFPSKLWPFPFELCSSTDESYFLTFAWSSESSSFEDSVTFGNSALSWKNVDCFVSEEERK